MLFRQAIDLRAAVVVCEPYAEDRHGLYTRWPAACQSNIVVWVCPRCLHVNFVWRVHVLRPGAIDLFPNDRRRCHGCDRYALVFGAHGEGE